MSAALFNRCLTPVQQRSLVNFLPPSRYRAYKVECQGQMDTGTARLEEDVQIPQTFSMRDEAEVVEALQRWMTHRM